MSGFLYCRVGDQRLPSIDDIRAWGLGYAFPDGSFESRPVSSSPGGGQGCVIGPSSAKAIGYYPAEQTWRRMPDVDGRPELWIGYRTDEKPTPTDLKREKLLRGPVLQLADGHGWQVPIVRRYDDAAQQWQSELPSYLDFDSAGNVVPGRPVAAYSHLWGVTEPIAELQFSKDSGEEAREPTQADLINAVVALLGANYKVGLAELIVLEALEETHLALIVLTSVRYESLVNWLTDIQKKSDPSTLSGATSLVGEMA